MPLLSCRRRSCLAAPSSPQQDGPAWSSSKDNSVQTVGPSTPDSGRPDAQAAPAATAVRHAAAGAKTPSSSDASSLRLVLPRRPAAGLAVEAGVAEGLPVEDSSAATGAQGLVADAAFQRQAWPPLQKLAAAGANHQPPMVPQAAPCTSGGAHLKVVPAAERSLPSAADLLQSLDAMLAGRGKQQAVPSRGLPGPSKVRTLGAVDHCTSIACGD